MKGLIFFIIIVILVSGCSKETRKDFGDGSIPIKAETPPIENTSSDATTKGIEAEPKKEVEQVLAWKKGGVALAGKYADADVVDFGSGKYRMYYSPEPEVQNFEGQVYSAVSSDGVTWVEEGAGNLKWATFPSVIKLPNGNYRMYFQNQGAIKSAISSDGLSWEEESGIRMDTANNVGLKLSNAAAPTVIMAGDVYVMVYRGAINEKYPAKVPNPDTQLLLWATSKDGLTFEKKGLALDSRNDEFQGLLDGPELVRWDDGLIRLYFWSYRGVYHTLFKGDKFLEGPEFDFTTASDAAMRFPENPPGDPTLVKISNKWFMYYGQHTKGIFYATL